MTTALYPLVLLLTAGAPCASDSPDSSRDGSYQFEGNARIEGTVWEGRLIPEANMIVRFEKGGVLAYNYGNFTHRTGSWKQTGNKVYIETNGKYAEYDAVIQGGRMIGSAHNVAKNSWKWEMERRPASAMPADNQAKQLGGEKE